MCVCGVPANYKSIIVYLSSQKERIKARNVVSLILLFTLLYIHRFVHPIMNIKQMLLKLAAATNLHAAYRTRVLRLLTALLTFVPCQRRFPCILFTACVARIFATVSFVIILGSMELDVTWKERILSVRTFNRDFKPRQVYILFSILHYGVQVH